MKHTLKRVFAMMMALALVFSMLPVSSVFAAETDADLTISTVEDLKAFAAAVNGGESYQGKTVVLGNDIDLGYTAVVIGTKGNPFKGTFDGQGYTVSNLTIYEAGADNDYFADTNDCLGLFGVINTPAVVKNVTVDNPYIVGEAYVGGIVGMAYTGTIQNCHVTGEIDIEGNYMVGGITGHGYAKIYDCSVIGEEGWDYSYIGATYKEADLEGDNVGGIVGHNAETNTISGCTVKNVTVSGTRKVGGIVGITAQNGIVEDCTVSDVTVETTATAEYAADNAKTMSIGGIVGQYQAAGSNNGALSNCTVENVTFVSENGVAVSAGALVGGLRGSDSSTVAPADTITAEGNTISGVEGSNVTYMEPVIVEVATYEELVAALANGGEIKLTADITVDSKITVIDGTTIDLNGKTLYINVENSYYNDANIKNGNVVLGKDDVHVCDGYFLVNAGKTLVLNGVNMSSSAEGIKGYAVFHLKTGANLDLMDSNLEIVDNAYEAGYIVYAGESTATVDITGTTVVGKNTNGIVHATTVIEDSNVTIEAVEHGINRSGVTITDSNVTISGGTGRGITAQHGDLVVDGNSVVHISNMGEATIELRGDKNLTIADTATVIVDAAVNNTTSGTISGTVKLPATGTVTPAYAKEVDGNVRIWGEGGGNASESYVLALYSGETLIATTTLNNVGGIIDGDVYVTWNFYYPASTDEYWTTAWEAGHPNSAAQPDKVVLYIDGEAVAENVAKMSAPDDLNPVKWEELGGVAYVVTGLKGTGTAEDPFRINNAEELKWFRDDVNSGNNYAKKTVVLTGDIDLANEEWTPIGNSSNPFNGNFNGQDHTISNLLITGSNSDVGLFGRTNNGEISNLTIHNAKVSGYLNVGVLAGTPYTTKYTNIKVTGDVIVEGFSYVGGVGGKNAYANWTDITVNVNEGSYVKATSTDANGTAYRTYVGGVVGFMGEGGHTFENISSNIDVYGDVCDVGGIVGIAHYGNKFVNVTCSGDVTNYCADPVDVLETGGIAGTWHNGGSDVTFDNVAFTGKVYTPNAADAQLPNGGLFGSAYSGSGSGEITGAVAVVAGKSYATLAEALAAVQEGETVTLLANVDADKMVISKNITIDLNSNTLKLVSGGNMINGNVKIINGTVDFTGVDTRATASSNTVISVNVGGTLTLDNINLTAENYTSAWAAICAMSGSSAGSTVNILNSTVNVSNELGGQGGFIKDQSGVNNYSVINIDNSTLNLSEVKRGFTGAKVNITDSTVTITGGEHGINGAELTASNSAINISGGTGRALTLSKFDVKVIDSDLNFSDMGEGEIRYKTANILYVDDASTIATCDIYADKSGAMVNTTEVTGTEDDMSSITNNVVTNPIYLAEINGVKYKTLAAAFANAVDGDTIVLMDDITLAESVVNTKAVTLDLNGKTITGTDNNTSGNFYLINNNKGNLTIDDTVGNGAITLTATTERNWNSSSVVVANQRGTLTVAGGTIQHLGGTSMAYGIDNLTNGTGTVATLNVTGGAIDSTYFAIRQFANNGTNNLNVSGGDISYIWMQSPNSNANVVNISVTGGEIDGICLRGVNAVVTLNVAANTTGTVYGTAPEGMAVIGSTAEGFKLIPIPELPTATVTELENEDLTFALNFKADEATEEQLAYYGKWYADFVLTVNKDVTFNANGGADGYLSGQYDAWSENWVNVPFENVTLTAGQSLKIMEYAAQLMGEPGLKLTYNDVYGFVKDFNCGIFFEPEFLAANPDFVVTLELRMYNPEDESESYVIGETYEFEAPKIVAENVGTGAVYATAAEALMASKSGETVRMLTNTDEMMIVVFDGITFDLNGYQVSAQYVTSYGDIVDNSESNAGLLVVAKNRFMIREDNAQVPSVSDSGYKFIEIIDFKIMTENGGAKLIFQPWFEDYASMLFQDQAAWESSGLTISVVVSWEANGMPQQQKFIYTPAHVMDVFVSYRGDNAGYNQAYNLILKNIDGLESLTMTAMVESETGVVVSCQP